MASCCRNCGSRCARPDVHARPAPTASAAQARRQPPQLGEHAIDALLVGRLERRAIGAEVFDAYLKVTIVRNPWDREVSRYFWATRADANPPPFDRWVRRTSTRPERKTWEIYALGDRCIADVVLRHETLGADFDALLARLGCPGAVSLPKAKGKFRPLRAYREFYTPETQAIVARRYAREIAYFGMTFEGAA